MSPLPATYFGSVNPDLLHRIPLTADRVLELGCGTGALGARFKWRRPTCRWMAIEIQPEAAAMAATVLDAVLCADIETATEAELDAALGQAPFDVLVFGDVLEHLREPLAVLQRLVGRLREGGAVVACIPNIGHWSIVRGLLQGTWTYEASGLLDAGHLRFFTQDSAGRLLADAGLVVRKVKSRDIPLDVAGQETFLATVRPLLPRLAGHAAEAEARLKALQYVLVAQKPPVDPLIEVHQTVMVRKLLEARVDFPFLALSTAPGVAATSSEKVPRRGGGVAGAPKVMVVQRQLVGEREAWLAGIRRLIADGWVLVAEWDDHPDLLPSPARETWLRHPWMPMSAAHACQVSTEALAQAFREHNPEVAVFENALLDCPPLPAKDPDRIRVLYAAVSRPGVSRLISPALDAVSQDPRVEIVVVGDEKVFASTRAARKTYHPLLPYGDYLDLLGRCDVNLMPLLGHAPELFKSPLKFFESASRGTVCIGSPALYEGAIDHGRTGWIARSQADFTALLTRAVAEGGERAAMARAAWDEVRARHLQAHQVARREAWYRELAGRRGALNEALFARHPELRP